MIVVPRTEHGARGLYQCKDGYVLKVNADNGKGDGDDTYYYYGDNDAMISLRCLCRDKILQCASMESGTASHPHVQR